jgi:hypothetical protein
MRTRRDDLMRSAIVLCVFAFGCGSASENPGDVSGDDQALTSDSNEEVTCFLEYATWAPSFIGGGGSGTEAAAVPSFFFAKDGYRLTMADDPKTGAKPFALVVAPLAENPRLMQVWLFNPDGSNESYSQVPLYSRAVGTVLFDVNARITPVKALDDQVQLRTFDFIHARCEMKRVGQP